MPEKVGFKDWQKVDMRVGKILEVEDIENADKLFKLKVDVGREKRQLVAGLKPYYKKEDLENRRCVVLINLEKKELMGIKSEGMILAAVNKDKSSVRLINPDNEIELGSKIQ